MAHILPHWTWPNRVGQLTPVHVFTSGDEAELFLNGRSLGRKRKGLLEYRLRWDDVTYEPGELKAVAYRDGRPWAEDVVKTAGDPMKLEASADRRRIQADGMDLAFITVHVLDKNGLPVPSANQLIQFTVEGPGQLVATDNGDPTNFVPFSSVERAAFHGLCLAIVRGTPGRAGTITVTARSPALADARVDVISLD